MVALLFYIPFSILITSLEVTAIQHENNSVRSKYAALLFTSYYNIELTFLINFHSSPPVDHTLDLEIPTLALALLSYIYELRQ